MLTDPFYEKSKFLKHNFAIGVPGILRKSINISKFIS